jgi:hypothetical protein
MGDGQRGIGEYCLPDLQPVSSWRLACLTCLDWRNDREADLSTEQAGAETATWLSCAYGN